jgi:hypothetical protein
MPVFIRNERPVIYDEDFLEPAVLIPPTKPLTTPPITTEKPVNVEVISIVEPTAPITTETPVNVGVSSIVEPNLSNPSGTTTSNTTSTSGSSNVPSGNTSGTSNVLSGSNEENKFIATITQKKPNYVLYGGILISAIILYKLLK